MKKNKKNITESSERIYVDESDLALLLKDERWTPNQQVSGVADGDGKAVVKELVVMPSVDLQSIDIERGNPVKTFKI